LSDAGRVASETPARHAVAGRIGRGENPPPQFGHTLCSFSSTHAAQKVHSKEQIRASADAGGRSRLQNSQFGRNSSAIAHPPGF
jgi:hypothetical protein